MSNNPNRSRLLKNSLLITTMLVLIVTLSIPSATSWGTSTHHDQADTMAEALDKAPNIPENVKIEIEHDTIYMAATAPDDWRNAKRYSGQDYDTVLTGQQNMNENAKVELQRVRDAWAAGDYDNAIFRIGSAMHYIGDAMEPCHNLNLRDYYENHVSPHGSELPMWGDEESAGGGSPEAITLWAHYGHHQVEAYSDSDFSYPQYWSSGWSLQPENYGPGDDGSLNWFLDNHYSPVMFNHISRVDPTQGNPRENDPEKSDNYWLYWAKTRDFEMAKADYDNSMRLAYNGAYRALRDGEYRRRTENSNDPPADWSYWPWPTSSSSGGGGAGGSILGLIPSSSLLTGIGIFCSLIIVTILFRRKRRWL